MNPSRLYLWLKPKTPDIIHKLARRWGCTERDITYHINGRKELSYSASIAISNDTGIPPEVISEEFAARRLANQTKPFSERPPSVNYYEEKPKQGAKALCLNCKGYGWTAKQEVVVLKRHQRFVWCVNCHGKGYVVYNGDGDTEAAQFSSTNLDRIGSERASQGVEEDEGANGGAGEVTSEDSE